MTYGLQRLYYASYHDSDKTTRFYRLRAVLVKSRENPSSYDRYFWVRKNLTRGQYRLEVIETTQFKSKKPLINVKAIEIFVTFLDPQAAIYYKLAFG